jgi:hypothetical protein
VEGLTKQGDIINFVKERSTVGDKKIKSKLQQYSRGANPELQVASSTLSDYIAYTE